MAQVDFYVLAASGQQARQQFACRLAEKAYKLGNKVHIQVTDKTSLQRLDDLLWTFRDGSFVPHEIDAGTASVDAPVTLGTEPGDARNPDLLINLSDTVPADSHSFPRVAEVVTSDEDSKTMSRQRFVTYREQGHTLKSHNI